MQYFDTIALTYAGIFTSLCWLEKLYIEECDHLIQCCEELVMMRYEDINVFLLYFLFTIV